MTCQEFREAHEPPIEELTPDEEAAISIHVESCPDCLGWLEDGLEKLDQDPEAQLALERIRSLLIEMQGKV